MLLSGDGGKNKNQVQQHWQVPCQTVVQDYNLFMGGVDTSNEVSGSYCCLINSPSLWKTLLFYMIHTAVCDARGVMHTCYSPSSPCARKEAAVQSSTSSQLTLRTQRQQLHQADMVLILPVTLCLPNCWDILLKRETAMCIIAGIQLQSECECLFVVLICV